MNKRVRMTLFLLGVGFLTTAALQFLPGCGDDNPGGVYGREPCVHGRLNLVASYHGGQPTYEYVECKPDGGTDAGTHQPPSPGSGIQECSAEDMQPGGRCRPTTTPPSHDGGRGSSNGGSNGGNNGGQRDEGGNGDGQHGRQDDNGDHGNSRHGEHRQED